MFMHYRTIFISDLHLGSKNSKTDLLLDFLRMNSCDYLYLVGDVIDIWALSSKWYWTVNQNTVVQKILRMARKGTKVFYILGNHDEFFRSWMDGMKSLSFGDIDILDSAVHTTADGKRCLVLHGDQFDGAIRSMGWLYWLGDKAYGFALFLNTLYNGIGKVLGFKYWSLSAYLKHKVKKAIQHVNNFEHIIVNQAREAGVQVVVCGHIHTPGIKDLNGILYINDGDWMESCSAAVEKDDGQFELLEWRHSGSKMTGV